MQPGSLVSFKASFWVYFALLGCVAPYWSLFLANRGFEPDEIGVLIGLFGVSRILFPNLWGALADHRATILGASAQDVLMRCALLLAGLFSVPFFSPLSFALMAIVITLYGSCWSGISPLLEARCMNFLGGHMATYGSVRLWGSVGFLIMVLCGGWLFEWFSIDIALPSVMFYGISLLLILTLYFPKTAFIKSTAPESVIKSNLKWLKLIIQSEVLAFMLVVFLMSLSHGPYYSFFSIYLADYGYNHGEIGLFWALGVLAEIAAFSFLYRTKWQLNPNTLIAVALAVATLRWAFMSLSQGQWPWLVCIQLLHAFTFGVMHAAAVKKVHTLFKGPHMSKGQALYASLGVASGAAIGAFWSGFFWVWFGPEYTFAVSAIVTLLTFILWCGLCRYNRSGACKESNVRVVVEGFSPYAEKVNPSQRVL